MSKKFLILFLLIIISAITILSGILIGTYNINLIDVIKVIISQILNLNLNTDDIVKDILLKIRIPRVLTAFITGSSLSLGGVIIQSILKNTLASPFTLGVSSGASLGVTIITVFGLNLSILSNFFQPLIGFIFGLMSVLILIKLSAIVDKGLSANTLVLLGMVFSLFINALQTLIISFSKEDIKQIIIWQMGSFAMKNWVHIKILLIFLICSLLLALLFTKELDILRLGHDSAKILGVNVNFTMTILIISATICSGGAIAICGIIGFVDLVTPHIARKFVGNTHIYLIPATILIGGIIMVIADLISRALIPPVEIPIGAITALIGSPFFAYIYFKDRLKT